MGKFIDNNGVEKLRTFKIIHEETTYHTDDVDDLIREIEHMRKVVLLILI